MAFPLQARSLKDLPQALVVTSEFDPLRDDGLMYADRLVEAGVPTDRQHFEELIHGFLHYDHLEAQSEAINLIGKFLSDAFANK